MKTRRPAKSAAFTLIELLTVMVIIGILAGLILGVAGFATRKGATARAEAEIKAMESGCDNYKTDVGAPPRLNASGSTSATGEYDTDKLDPRENFDPASANKTVYQNSSKALYAALSGDYDYDGQKDAGATAYMSFEPKMIGRTNMTAPVSAPSNAVRYISDPFSNSYGYSTANQADPTKGFNPTYDLWSTAGIVITSSTDTVRWVKNW